MGTSWYDTAQVCLNGHAVNDMVRAAPQLNKDFCTECGAPTITACQNCKAPIQGEYHVPGVFGFGAAYSPPSFCHKCGAAYPWTEAKLQAARELADELDELSPDEIEVLKGALTTLLLTRHALRWLQPDSRSLSPRLGQSLQTASNRY
jgi:hypothetical protein